MHSLLTFNRAALIALLAVVLSLGGCGSTKVYTADKTILYNGSLYNMSNVKEISSDIQGTLANGDTVNMRAMDKKAIEALFKQHDSIAVKTTVKLDDRDMVYENARVSKYSAYSRMVKDFDQALSSISKFMADKKKTQLKLR